MDSGRSRDGCWMDCGRFADGCRMQPGRYRAAVARGAVPLWMPMLEPAVAAEIEAKRLHFSEARDGIVPEGRKVTPLGTFDRSRVRRWLEAMNAEFEAIRSWLP